MGNEREASVKSVSVRSEKSVEFFQYQIKNGGEPS